MLQSKIGKSFIVLAFLYLAFGCKKEDLAENPVDSIIQVRIEEVTINNIQQLVLTSRTKREYNCFNYTIITDQEFTDEAYHIKFLGVDKPNKCATAIGLARKEIVLGSPPNGVYELVLSNGPSLTKARIANVRRGIS